MPLTMSTISHEDRLRGIVGADPELMEILRVVRSVEPPGWLVGLEDMFNVVLRRNPRRVSLEEFHRRCRDKHVLERWPRVRMIDG
ncbi:MAG: nucleotidyltransferase family protein [Actinomycetota bacterium]|nr:nucleotidyltransferase family protein [Actinomycetota bacterium]